MSVPVLVDHDRCVTGRSPPTTGECGGPDSTRSRCRRVRTRDGCPAPTPFGLGLSEVQLRSSRTHDFYKVFQTGVSVISPDSLEDSRVFGAARRVGTLKTSGTPRHRSPFKTLERRIWSVLSRV